MAYLNIEDYNKWRRQYRKKRVEKGLCHRCGRPLLEDSNKIQCEVCNLDGVQRRVLGRNFNGDN